MLHLLFPLIIRVKKHWCFLESSSQNVYSRFTDSVTPIFSTKLAEKICRELAADSSQGRVGVL